MKGGRPPMAPNRLSRKRAMELCANKESPLDVMFDNMLFWHRQSKDLCAKFDAGGVGEISTGQKQFSYSPARLKIKRRASRRHRPDDCVIVALKHGARSEKGTRASPCRLVDCEAIFLAHAANKPQGHARVCVPLPSEGLRMHRLATMLC
jgi:hypothetical protein